MRITASKTSTVITPVAGKHLETGERVLEHAKTRFLFYFYGNEMGTLSKD